MRANQPMGLTPAAHALLEGLVRTESGERFYEGYWDERFPLGDYVDPAPIAGLLARRDAAQTELDSAQAELDRAARELAAGGAARYREYEQDVLFSSGPVMFLALRDQDGAPVTVSLWSACAMAVGAEGECRCAGTECAPRCDEGCR